MEEIDGGFLRIFCCLFVLFIYLHFEGSSGGLVRDLSDFVEKWKQRFSGRFHFRLTDTIGRLIRWHRSVHRKCRQRTFETPGPGERLWDGRSWRYVCERPVILGTSDADPPEAFDCVPHWNRWHQLGGPVHCYFRPPKSGGKNPLKRGLRKQGVKTPWIRGSKDKPKRGG